jgi:hypothetical protein
MRYSACNAHAYNAHRTTRRRGSGRRARLLAGGGGFGEEAEEIGIAGLVFDAGHDFWWAATAEAAWNTRQQFWHAKSFGTCMSRLGPRQT